MWPKFGNSSISMGEVHNLNFIGEGLALDMALNFTQGWQKD